MLRSGGSRVADKMDVLALVRAKECQPVASDDFMDLLGRTAKNELALVLGCAGVGYTQHAGDRKSTRLNSSHRCISYAVFCLKKKKNKTNDIHHKEYNMIEIL